MNQVALRARAFRVVLFFFTCFIGGLSTAALADWSHNPNAGANIIIRPTPHASCQAVIDINNAALPANTQYNYRVKEPLEKSGEYPGGYWNCRAESFYVVANPTVGLPASPGYTVLYNVCNAGETQDRTYTRVDGCLPANNPTSTKTTGCPACIPELPNGPDDTGITSTGTAHTGGAGGGGLGGGSGKSSSGGASYGRMAKSSSPVDIQSGNIYYEVTDYESAGPNRLSFKRIYNSVPLSNITGTSSLGSSNWRHSFDKYVTGSGGGPAGTFEREDGKLLNYANCGIGGSPMCYTDNDVDYTVTRTVVGNNITIRVIDKNDTIETYLAYNYGYYVGFIAPLQSITYRNGYTITLDRSVTNTLTATDSYGRVLQLNYDSNGLLQSVNTPDSTTINYAYTTGRYRGQIQPSATNLPRLSQVTYPDAPSSPVTYNYLGTEAIPAIHGSYGWVDMSGTNFIPGYLLETVTDQNGNISNKWTYDQYTRALSTEGYNGLGKSLLSYNNTNGARTVTHPSGAQDTYTYGYNSVRLLSVSRAAGTGVAAASASITYDSYGYVNSLTDWMGYKTTITNNRRGQPTRIYEGKLGTALHLRNSTYTYSTTAAPAPYPANYYYHTLASSVEGYNGETTSGALRSSAYTYDTKGNMLTRTVNDVSGYALPARTWTYTYDSLGLPLTAQDPVGNTTTFTYTNGSLATITDPLSHVTTFSNFTAGGRPQTITDINGVVHSIAYDSRQRVTSTSITVGGTPQTTTYDWTPGNGAATGRLSKVTLPDATWLMNDYGYEAPTPTPPIISDAAGNKRVSTLNVAGQATKLQTKDSGGTVAFERNRTYDALGRVLTESDSTGTKITSFTYDKNGNLLTVTDPLSHTTTYTYDKFNRRLTATDHNGGVTTYTYDNLNRTKTVTAPGPGTRTTTYNYNSFGDVMSEVSPDTGTTSYTYDKNSNPLSKTDAASAVTNYTWDALDRLATVTYPADSSLNVTNTYDQTGHGFGIGRLTSVTDAAGTLSLDYDERGNVTARNRTTPAGTMNLAATYDVAGRPASLTYPSGLVITYTRDTAGNIASVSYTPPGGSPTTLATYSAGYLPFGPMKGVALANGVTTNYAYNTDLLMTGITDNSSLQNLTFGYDNANNLTSITDSITAANTQTFGYDVIDRLTSAVSGSGGYGTLGYTYDANGNRLTAVVNGVTTTSTYTANTNKLATIGGVAVTHTSAGNISAATIGGTAYTFAYNKANRLATTTTSAGTATNTYDAFGNRTIKTVGGNTTIYANGMGNELLEENTGGTRTDYIYINGVPIAQFSGSTLTYLHADQRGTPALATNASKAVQWSATLEPFGKVVATTGGLTQSVRLPGQTADTTTIFQNGYRDYMPELARYPESDPIGLRGGLNTYTYVGNMPMRYSDKKGLSPDNFMGIPLSPSSGRYNDIPGIASGFPLPPKNAAIGFSISISTINPFTSTGGGITGVNFECTTYQGCHWYKMTPAKDCESAGFQPGPGITLNYAEGTPSSTWDGFFDEYSGSFGIGSVGYFKAHDQGYWNGYSLGIGWSPTKWAGGGTVTDYQPY